MDESVILKKNPPLLITVRLPRESEGEDQPLGELFDQALRTMHLPSFRDFEPSPSERRWLLHTALRAVCEAIIAKGCVPLPLTVDLKHPDDRIRRRKVVTRADILPTVSNVIPFPEEPRAAS